MAVTRFTLIAGILFVLVGIMGFIPGLTVAPDPADPALMVEHTHGRLLGLFPVNLLHNCVHIALGLWALFSFRKYESARIYCKATAWIYGILAIMGFFPGLNTVFGLIPLHSHDIWLHAVLAVAHAFFGYATFTRKVPVA